MHPRITAGRRILLVLTALCCNSHAAKVTTQEVSGPAVGIAGDDTFTLLASGNTQIKIKLAEIDAPEGGQPYGSRPRQALTTLVFGKDARVAVQTTDHYGRTVGRPHVGKIDVCAEMVREGAASAYRQ